MLNTAHPIPNEELKFVGDNTCKRRGNKAMHVDIEQPDNTLLPQDNILTTLR